MWLPVLLVICEMPTAQMVYAERGSVTAVVHLVVMVVVTGVGLISLLGGAWSYRETYAAAYYNNFRELEWLKLMGADKLTVIEKEPVPKWVRLRDAQRWARWLTLAELALAIALAYAVCTTILDCLWDTGLVTTVRPMTAFTVTTSVYGQVLWTLADSIPALDLPNAFQWADPAPFHDSLIVDVTLLVARVAVFGPVIAWIIAAYRGSGCDPREPVVSDKVVIRVIRGLNTFERASVSREDDPIISDLISDRLEAGFPHTDLRARDRWEHAIEFASKALEKELSEKWSPNRILAYLAANRTALGGLPG